MKDLCKICFASKIEGATIFMYLFKEEDVVCFACRSRFQVINKEYRFKNLDIYILFLYDDFMEGLLFQYKECRDIALKDVFLNGFVKQINDKFRGYTIVLVASHIDKNKERGFYALQEMFANVSLEKVTLFEKSKKVKQSSQSFSNRDNIKSVIRLRAGIVIPQTPLLIVDDVCTSGATLQSSYACLRNHPLPIKALVMSANALFVESCDEIEYAKNSKRNILKSK